MRALGLSTVGVLALAMSSVCFGQAASGGDQPTATPGQASGTTAYDTAFFKQFAPRTALDIARRVPGFNLDLGNTDIRGFSAAAGNVVINGARPSSKAESLETTLTRIPANRVSKVELGAGSLFGADYSTKSQVLNIFLSAEGGVDGNVTASARHLYDGKLVPDLSASALIRRGASSINLSAGTGNTVNHEEGTDTLIDAQTGEFIEHRRKFNSYQDFNPYVSGSWALERGNDDAIRANARWSPGQFDLEQRNRVSPAVGPQHDDSLIQDYDNPVFELGGDVTRPLGGGAIKLVGLATRRKRDYFDGQTFRNGLIEDDADVVGGVEQRQKAKRNETIGRLTWTRQDLGGFSVETGAEAVLNTLESSVKLEVINEDGTRNPVIFPSANVKEKRGELFLEVGRALSPALRVDAGIRYEYSHLTVTGDSGADRKLKFWKPGVTVDWKPGAGWHSQFSIKRTVAQLDFYDFITVAELSTDRINGGNQNLQPQQAWEFRATADHPLLGDGLIKLDLGYDLISMLQDRVLIVVPGAPGEEDIAVDAPGNIGAGKHLFAQLTVDAPLDRLWKGLRVKANGTIRRTRVHDPISGDLRNFSGYFPNWEWSVDVRRDSGPLSYGFVVSDRARFTDFRTDEFDTNYNGGLYGTAFVEYRPGPRTSITLDLDNALQTTSNRHRLRFSPNRANPKQVIDELRDRNRHLNFGLTIKQTFGGGRSSSAPIAPQ